MTGRARSVVLAYIGALNDGDVDRVAALVRPDFSNEHTSTLGRSVVGRDAYRAKLPKFLADFAGLHYAVEDLFADEDKVAVAYVMTAQCTGGDGMIRPIEIRGMFRFYVDSGLIARRVDYFDSAEFQRQVNP